MEENYTNKVVNLRPCCFQLEARLEVGVVDVH